MKKVKLVKESLNEYLNEYSDYGYYNMANGLDMTKTIIPELRKNNIKFSYDGYSNFMTIEVEPVKSSVVKHIIENIGDGCKYEYDIDEDSKENDGILVKSIN
jgi:hypothetical protein